jgi:hypothetical protein
VEGKVSIGQFFEFLKSIIVIRAMLRSFIQPALLVRGFLIKMLQWLDGAR